MKRLFFLFSLFFYTLGFGQDGPAYNAIYQKTYLETAQTDIKAALKIADSLYTISETPLFKTKSLMLSATLYKQSGDVKNAIQYALESEKIIEQTDNYIWQSRVLGFLASQYRALKLYGRSKQYLDKSFGIINKIENPKLVNSTMGLMLQELAYVELEQKNYKKSITNINKAQTYFNLTPDNLDFFTTNNEQLLGLNYYHLKDLDKATSYYDKALKSANKMPESFLTGLIYNGFALIYIEKNDLKNAKRYLDLAETVSNKSQYLVLNEEIYSTSKKYYALTKDLKKLEEVTVKKDSVTEQITNKSNEFINESFAKLEKENIKVEKKSSNKTLIIIVFSILILGGICYVIWSRRKHKENLQKVKNILRELELKSKEHKTSIVESKPILVEEHETQPEVEKGIEKEKSEIPAMMNSATEEKILEKLNQFEESDLFRQNNVSLSSLATFCETNNKYLSYVINTFKKKDFNNYINELRVDYIIKKLNDHPISRKYKIAVLAEEAGFSSQNKFATVFKKVTSISPSLFINFLDENDENIKVLSN